MTEEYVIDCDAAPFIPEGWSIREADQLKNRVRGTFIWDPAKVRLYLSQGLEGGRIIEGNELRKELKSERVLNANVLDYLLEPEHRHLIPAEWKKSSFWCSSGVPSTASPMRVCVFGRCAGTTNRIGTGTMPLWKAPFSPRALLRCACSPVWFRIRRSSVRIGPGALSIFPIKPSRIGRLRGSGPKFAFRCCPLFSALFRPTRSQIDLLPPRRIP